MRRTAVVLFNLGGPDSLEAVRPFLKNLFSDPAIISVPNPVRWILARLILKRRAPVARAIYAEIGGRSPILDQTRDQAKALQSALSAAEPACEWLVDIAMRYWHPFSDETVKRVAAFAPDRIVLLPLYPQYSGTTAGSSINDWLRASGEAELQTPITSVCCYPDETGFVSALAERTAAALREARETLGQESPIRLLLSAHGLPKKVIARGDPYQWQVEQTVAALGGVLYERGLLDGVEVVTCYQSRVGPLEWIGPATDAEVRRAGANGAGIVMVPVAFVSEHSETLVELDIEYRKLAEASGARCYTRVATVGTDQAFIDGLAGLVRDAERSAAAVLSAAEDGRRICPAVCARCAQAAS